VHDGVVHCTVYQQSPGLRSPGSPDRDGSPSVSASAGVPPRRRAVRRAGATPASGYVSAGCDPGTELCGRLLRRGPLRGPVAPATSLTSRRVKGPLCRCRALVQRTPIGAVVTREPHLTLRFDTDPTRSEHLRRDTPRQAIGQERAVLSWTPFHHLGPTPSYPSMEINSCVSVFGTKGRKL
jgi:hypothetical protein